MNKEVLQLIQEKYANKSLNLGDELRNAEIDLPSALCIGMSKRGVFTRVLHEVKKGNKSMIGAVTNLLILLKEQTRVCAILNTTLDVPRTLKYIDIIMAKDTAVQWLQPETVYTFCKEVDADTLSDIWEQRINAEETEETYLEALNDVEFDFKLNNMPIFQQLLSYYGYKEVEEGEYVATEGKTLKVKGKNVEIVAPGAVPIELRMHSWRTIEYMKTI